MGGVGHIEVPQQPVMVVHEVVGDVDAPRDVPPGASRFTRLLICEICYEKGCPDPDTGLIRAASARRTGTVEWWALDAVWSWSAGLKC
ncbi:hypothetical protein [Streptomyces anulatus]|uniref:hypothetical protein n=1 Tax=Streptomyces anulatus TaxID=1892 RepID=UPI003669D13B